MGVQDAYLPPTSGSSAGRSGGQYTAAYRHDGPHEPALLNGYHGSRGWISSEHAHTPFVPHQTSYQPNPMQNNNAASISAAPMRKRKAPEAGVAVIDLTGDSPPNEAPKRKRRARSSSSSDERTYSYHNHTRVEAPKGHPAKRITSRARTSTGEKPERVVNHTGKQQLENLGKSEKSHAAGDTGEKPKKKAKQDGEKRMRRFRAHAPTAFREVRDRALTQRMFALDRVRSNDNPEHPSETISLAGTTGNVYTIIVDKVPTCDCPHAKKGNQCKHIVYVLSRVLRAPADLEYQLAFVSSELRTIFENSPPLPSETAGNDAQDGSRKPIEGECPICCDDFEPGSSENVVYCKAACGNNIHKECFGHWAATKKGQTVTCPFCRAPWQGDEIQLKEVAKSGRKNAEGYVNVASQLGLSGRRDYSTYNSYWVRGKARRGQIAWDEDGVMDHEY
jgi:hypothetical protein